MDEKPELSRQSFQFLAREAGLDVEDPHMERLYAYMKELLPKIQGDEEKSQAASSDKDLHTFIQRYIPKLKRIADLDLAGIDPSMVFRAVPGRKA
jgi:hypothetical protein